MTTNYFGLALMKPTGDRTIYFRLVQLPSEDIQQRLIARVCLVQNVRSGAFTADSAGSIFAVTIRTANEQAGEKVRQIVKSALRQYNAI